ncbi:MAG: acyltransferase family protein [Deltaproteobacteria bacterium]|nr:acyltransferase family protein [Deltaproteobacteria bacterium]
MGSHKGCRDLLLLKGERDMQERRYDIDWLRVFVMLAVFFFHCARFFCGVRWHLNNNEQSIVALVFVGWLDMWFMPLFFLLSGVGSWYALRSVNNGQYLLDRVKRILVPLYTVGLFLLLPPQLYFEIFSNRGYAGTFWEMLPHYFSDLRHFSFDWPGGLVHVPFSGHLWFLQFLFLISVLALPLMRYLRSEKGLRLIDTLAGWCNRRGGIFLFLVPVIIIRIGLRSVFLGEHAWADFFEFVVFFIIGYILPADIRFTESVKKHGWTCLVLGIACFIGEGFFTLGLGYKYLGDEPFSLIFVLFETIVSIGRWSWIVFVLGLGARHLNFNRAALAYCNEAVLPFYIFHQTIILCVGWFVIPWDIGVLPKYLIIVAASFTLIMALYEGLVRRFKPMRVLFGMRPKKKPYATHVPGPEGAVA